MRIPLATFVLWLGLSSMSAQMFAGNHSLDVQVSLADGSSLQWAVKVEVSDQSGTPIAEAYTTHQQGVAEFSRNFPDGLFRITVSGNGIETTTVGFQIAPTESEHREYVRVRLLDKASPSSKADGPLVSVQEMEIPEKARRQFRDGLRAYDNGNIQQAQKDFENAIALYPKYARAHHNLGVLWLKLNDGGKAKQEFTRAIDADPALVPSYGKLAKLLVGERKFSEAERLLRKAASVDPTALDILVMLSSTEYANQEYDDALADARKVHRFPGHEQYADVHLVAAEILIKQGKKKDAVSEFEAFQTESPNDPRVPKVRQLAAQLRLR